MIIFCLYVSQSSAADVLYVRKGKMFGPVMSRYIPINAYEINLMEHKPGLPITNNNYRNLRTNERQTLEK